MDVKYTYTTSIDYSRQLEFDYIETYSFRRGEEYEDKITAWKPEYDKFKRRDEKGKLIDAEERNRLQELNGIFGYTQYLLDADGNFHFSSIKTNTFKKDDVQTVALLQILKTPITEVPRFMCAPEYRDAIAFYNQAGQIVSSLNVCLSCLLMETKMFHHINADFETYDLLKRWFMSIGHEVESPDYFIMDEINRLKDKRKKS